MSSYPQPISSLYPGGTNCNNYCKTPTLLFKGTSNYKLIYKGSNALELSQTYSNALHGGCKESSHSTAVGWLSK